MSGGVGRAVVNPGTPRERVLKPLSDGNVVTRGDVLLLETGGGGGHGDPFERHVEAVLEDVMGGFVSEENAAQFYGVVLDGETVDAAATAARRARRPAVRNFHRHRYVDALV